MGNLFSRSSNDLPPKIVLGIAVLGLLLVIGISYYFTPKYSRVGYMPTQPIPFDHSLHTAQLGLDCRFCHSYVEKSGFSNLPTTQTCMNCHRQVKMDSPKLAPLRESWETGKPIQWVRIHQLPDYVYFDHSAHVNRGISCVSCHGQVNRMKEVYHDKPLSMSWCLDCHRNPEYFIRPQDKVFDMDWKPEHEGKEQITMGKKLVEEMGIHPPENCDACHR
ncbi:cytochrome c3 family protein [Methylacidiphilum caldifontis]|uniref:Cytochrome C n=1 Tax=Methylacidiphilum caldifontis TaxID=2795386 RepID=A0A4Y8PG81_9BACT|nr:cytochrome c3 family protein [Methylacidiphilum caldifontis]QSR89561.1 cytochrome c3 family protein [Methylacidiphilum caldifontis]TFE71129.1 cytochrome C [Methylacidiphilum caldifontis]